jgi:hypothetical protein
VLMRRVWLGGLDRLGLMGRRSPSLVLKGAIGLRLGLIVL